MTVTQYIASSVHVVCERSMIIVHGWCMHVSIIVYCSLYIILHASLHVAVFIVGIIAVS